MTGDRRPVAARGWRLIQAMAAWLIAHGASANAVSIAGMLAGLGAGAAFGMADGQSWLWLLGAALIWVRLLANVLDGMVAVGRGTASAVGELYNEVPDRVSDSCVLVGLGAGAGQVALGLLAALIAMATAYVRAVIRGAGGPSDFSGPMAKPHRMWLASLAGALCAVLPETRETIVMAALWVIVVLSAVTALRRLVAGARALGG